jgi:hypothetical protein
MELMKYLNSLLDLTPVTVGERFKAWTVFALSDALIVGSNPTSSMDVWCMCAFILFVLSSI